VRAAPVRVALGLALGFPLLAWQEIEGPPARLRRPDAGAAAARGCGCSHACRPVTYQGCGCGEISCFPGGERLRALKPDSKASASLSSLAAGAPCEGGLAAGTFPCFGIDLESHMPLEALLPGSASASNLWGFSDLDDGREYAVVGVSHGTAVVDVTDPALPRVVGSVPGPESAWREVKVFQRWNPQARRHEAFAYVVSEAPTAGLQILDLTNLPDSVSLAATFREFDTSHTLTLANVDPATGAAEPGGPDPVLYVQGARNPTVGIHALGIADPVSPAVLGRYTLSYAHDTWTGRVKGERARGCRHDPCDLVVAWTGQNITVLDWTERSSPEVIAEVLYPNLGYSHSGFISPDGNFLFSMDEFDEKRDGGNSSVRVLDVTDWSHPALVTEWRSGTTAIEHNGYTLGNRYYIAHYERGLTILDVSYPPLPGEIAFFDTFPAGEAAEFHGAWGVYPYLPSGTLLVSNIDGASGLFLLRERAETPRDPIVRPPTRARRPRVVDAPRPIP
jgi:choice-of-anchor B domain-containing protein